MLADFYATCFGFHTSNFPDGTFLLQGPGRRLVVGPGKPGERPSCLLDYFPEDFLVVVDESHVTIPQVGGM